MSALRGKAAAAGVGGSRARRGVVPARRSRFDDESELGERLDSPRDLPTVSGREVSMEEAAIRRYAVVERSARRGAAAVTRNRQLVDDAAAFALERWEDAVLYGKQVSNLGAWAFRIGMNAAKRLASRRTRQATNIDAAMICAQPEVASALDEEQRAHLRTGLSAVGSLLRGRQRQVLSKLLEDGMTFHRAAKDLGMERHALRRSFHSGTVRLGLLLRNYPPPSSSE